MKCFKVKGVEVMVYEFVLEDDEFFWLCVVCDLDVFKVEVDVIIVNCMIDEILDVVDKVFICDLFGFD